MAIANLQETWRTYTLRKNALSVEISNLQAQRTLATYQQGDSQTIKAQEEQEIREKYKALFNGDEEAFKADGIKRYDDIPDFDSADFDKDVEYIKNELSDEDFKKQIKMLAPEFKASEVFKLMNSNNRPYPIAGHEKRILMRKLIRDAKSGKLDKYFINK